MSLQTGVSSNRVKGAVNQCNDKQRERRSSCNEAVEIAKECVCVQRGAKTWKSGYLGF